MDRFQIGDYWLSKRPGSESWQRTWFDSQSRQTRRASLGTADVEQARLALAKWVALNQAPRRANDLPLGQVILRYWEHHGKHQRSADAIRHNLRHWTEYFGPVMVSELTRTAQTRFIRHLKAKGLSDGYIQRIFTIGRAAVQLALVNREIIDAPAILYVPAEPKPPRTLTPEESGALISAAQSEHGRMYLLLAHGTWARMEAILELTRFQVRTDERLIYLNPPGRVQTKKRRPTVPICDHLLPLLEAAPAGYLVNWHGRPVKSVKTLLRDCAKRAGIGPIDSRTIRHTMATWARDRGVPWHEIEAMLGHRIRSTSSLYAQWTPRHDGPAACATDAYLTATHLQRSFPQLVDSIEHENAGNRAGSRILSERALP